MSSYKKRLPERIYTRIRIVQRKHIAVIIARYGVHGVPWEETLWVSPRDCRGSVVLAEVAELRAIHHIPASEDCA